MLKLRLFALEIALGECQSIKTRFRLLELLVCSSIEHATGRESNARGLSQCRFATSSLAKSLNCDILSLPRLTVS